MPLSFNKKTKSILIDNWLTDYEKTRILIKEIIQNTTRRRQLTIGHTEYSQLSLTLRIQLKEADKKLEFLEKDLTSLNNHLVPGEQERRLRLWESLKTEILKASQEFKTGMAYSGPFTKVADLGTGDWNDGEETEVTKEYSNSQLKDQKINSLKDQDEALENLSSVVHSQKNIAKAIQSEVDDQDDLLIDITDRIADNRNNLEEQTSNVVTATRKSSTCGYWIVILCLLIAIIVVAVW